MGQFTDLKRSKSHKSTEILTPESHSNIELVLANQPIQTYQLSFHVWTNKHILSSIHLYYPKGVKMVKIEV